MAPTAKVVLHSAAENHLPIITVAARYPKFIHGELMTHRAFSRNASSSRAIPTPRLIQDVIDDPAMPVKWFKNKPGMQGTEEIFGAERRELEIAWLVARDNAVETARGMTAWGAHKQHVNRVIEPFCHINTLITSTHWSNFFALRDHKDADPTIQALAVAIKEAIEASKPRILKPGEWHLPYVTVGEHIEQDYSDDPIPYQVKLSVARCARVSYLTQDGQRPLPEQDLKLYDKLVGSAPLHASPAEHQATPDTGAICVDASRGPKSRKSFWQWDSPHLHGNFTGWIQYRKMLPGENVADTI